MTLLNMFQVRKQDLSFEMACFQGCTDHFVILLRAQTDTRDAKHTHAHAFTHTHTHTHTPTHAHTHTHKHATMTHKHTDTALQIFGSEFMFIWM